MVAFIIGVVLVISIGSTVLKGYEEEGVSRFKEIFLKRFLLPLESVCLFTLFISPFFLEYAGQNFSDYDFAACLNEKEQITTSGFFVYCTSENLHYSPANKLIKSEVKPVTENPKVRDIFYNLEVTVSNQDKMLRFLFEENRKFQKDHLPRSAIESFDSEKVINSKVKYLLYEFNNFHSKEIANFYNPLDVKQKQGFTDLLSANLNSDLEKIGLKVAGVTWDVK